jgi:hypothetical protein
MLNARARRMVAVYVIGMLAALLTVSVPARASESRSSVVITKKQYGKRWPFTVPRGDLYCHGLGAGIGDVMFRVPFPAAHAGVYGLNGLARQHLHLPGINAIWRKDPQIPGARVNIGPIIERGLKLCR